MLMARLCQIALRYFGVVSAFFSATWWRSLGRPVCILSGERQDNSISLKPVSQ